jgi:hypothetical protein
MFQIVQAAFVVGIGRQDRRLRLVQIQGCFPELPPQSCQVGLRQAEIIGQKLIADLLCYLSSIAYAWKADSYSSRSTYMSPRLVRSSDSCHWELLDRAHSSPDSNACAACSYSPW